MSREAIDTFLQGQFIGHLGTLSEGRPYIVPVSYLYQAQSIYFATESGQKITSLLAHPEVCFEVDEAIPEAGQYRSVIAYGAARPLTDRDRQQEILRELIGRFERHSPRMITRQQHPSRRMASAESAGETVVVEIPIESISGREALLL